MKKEEYRISFNPESGEIDSQTLPYDFIEFLVNNGIICEVRVENRVKYFVNSFILPNVISNPTLMAIFEYVDYCRRPTCKKHSNYNKPHINCINCKWRMPIDKEEAENPPFFNVADNYEQGEPPEIDDNNYLNYKPMSYSRYLNTKYWKEFREKAIEYYGGKCSWCGASGEGVVLQVHHIRYEKNRFDEKLENVILLCDSCHRKAHGKY